MQQAQQQQAVQPHTRILTNPEWAALQQQLGFSVIMGTRSMGDLLVLSVPNPDSVNFHIVQFPLCMGMDIQGDHLAVACQTDIRQYHDMLVHPGIESPVYQKCYSPRSISFTGDLDIHELKYNQAGTPLFVASKYSCLGIPSATHSMKPVWQPKFIKELKPVDACHLNGLCMEDGEAKYVTLFAPTAEPNGWRDMPFNAGMLWSVEEQEAVCSGLVQPHSPRLHEGELYVLNSGAGEFGRIDLKTGTYECIAFVGGYGRGLSFIGDYAVFGISKPRHNAYIQNFPLHDRLRALGEIDRCQLVAVNLKTGDVIPAVTFEGAARELFDTLIIPDCRHAVVMNLDEAQHPQLVVLEGENSVAAFETSAAHVADQVTEEA